MAVLRLSTLSMSLAVALCLLLCWCTVGVQGQSYVPQPPPLTSCPPGQQLITLGTMDTSNTTLFPDNDGNSILFTDDYFPYVYVTPFTLRGQNAFGVSIQQMALRVLDNRFWLLQPAKIRLAIYLYQEAEKNAESFDLAALVGQSDEITVRPHSRIIQHITLHHSSH